MKKILLLVTLVLLTYTSICQTATQPKANHPSGIPQDSLIYLPKSLVIQMIQDLSAGDICQEENQILNNSLEYNQKIISKQDSVIVVYKEKVKTYQNEVATYEDLDTENQKTIQNLNGQLSKEKRKNKVLTIFSTIFLGIAAGFALSN